jgi:hypothetical protein
MDESMSRQPASSMGWLPTTPTVLPFMRAKPMTMFLAASGMISNMVPSSTTAAMAIFMS